MTLYDTLLFVIVSWVFIGWVGVVILWCKCGFSNIVASGLNEPAAIIGPILAGFFFGPVLLYMVLHLEPSFTADDEEK